MKVLLVDDEAPARARMRGLLAKEADVVIAGECADGIEAIDMITALNPDLVFLDIQMPGADGFDVLRQIPRTAWPLVVFVTAYDEHAVRAFDVHALDYLLKPFPAKRLTECIARARTLLSSSDAAEVSGRIEHLLREAAGSARDPAAKRLIVKDGSKITVVPYAEVVSLQACGNYAEIHTLDSRRLLLRETMHSLEARLEPSVFFRVNRSALVNLQHVREIVSEGRGSHMLVLTGNQKIPLTASLEELQQRLAGS